MRALLTLEEKGANYTRHYPDMQNKPAWCAPCCSPLLPLHPLTARLQAAGGEPLRHCARHEVAQGGDGHPGKGQVAGALRAGTTSA